MTQAMILGAGLGTRLRPLTLELPKPAVFFGDQPLFALQVAQLRAAGFRVAAMNASYMHEALQPLAEAVSVPLSLEEAPLGTAGAIAHARRTMGRLGDPLLRDEPTLVHNGDVYTAASWGILQGDLRGALARMAVRERPLGEGAVGWNAAGQVVRLRGVRVGEEDHSGDFLGVHLLGTRAIRLCANGCLVGDVYIPELVLGARIEVVVVAAQVWDVGDARSYHDAVMAWSQGGWSSPDAQIAGHTSRSVVGRHAHVLAEIDRVVVWPGARVEAPLHNAIVTPERIVQLP